MKPRQLYCEVYQQNIEIYDQWAPEDFIKYVRSDYPDFVDDIKPDEHGSCWQQHDAFILWTRDGSSDDILVHECVHLRNMIFKNAGVKLDIDNDEHEAYYTQMLFRFAKQGRSDE